MPTECILAFYFCIYGFIRIIFIIFVLENVTGIWKIEVNNTICKANFFFQYFKENSLTAQLNSTKPELRFCAGSNPACGLSEIQMVKISDNGPGWK